MIEKEHYLEIAQKYGEFASWAIWAEEGQTPKSNMGDISIFDLKCNPNILNQVNPEVVMVGLNFLRVIEKETFVNFHDKRPQAQDFKIRYAFKNTKYYGAYMTDIVKDFAELISGNVMSYLKANKDFEHQNIALFKQEVADLRATNPLIIAFGNHVYNILLKHFKNQYKIVKVPHYSMYISKEDYKKEVDSILNNMNNIDLLPFEAL